MEHVEYVYTAGLSEGDVQRHLRNRGHGVLALADGGDSYAVPLNYHYDGDRILVRLSTEPDSRKIEFVETTETATLVVYDVDGDASWSVLIRGEIRRLPEAEQATFTDTAINEAFPPFRLFDEDVDAVEMAIYELDPDEITGRRSVASE